MLTILKDHMDAEGGTKVPTMIIRTKGKFRKNNFRWAFKIFRLELDKIFQSADQFCGLDADHFGSCWIWRIDITEKHLFFSALINRLFNRIDQPKLVIYQKALVCHLMESLLNGYGICKWSQLQKGNQWFMVFGICILKIQWNGVSLTRKSQDTIVQKKTIFAGNQKKF